MPKFMATKLVDAYARYSIIVEAESAEEAFETAYAQKDDAGWIRDGHSEFDDIELFHEDVVPVSDAEAAELEESRHDMTLRLRPQDHATIMAALRFYQEKGMGDPANRSDAIHDLATNGDEVISLDAEGIDDLCERINFPDIFSGTRGS